MSLSDNIKQLDEAQTIRLIVKGNEEAALYCEQFFSVCQIWDDLIDKDKEVSDSMINTMMWLTLLEMPKNRFFQQYSHELIPVMRQYVIDWFDANQYENKKDDHSLSISYVLRDSINQLLVQCAYLIGGAEWAANVSFSLRERVHDESIADYAAKIKEGA